MPNTGELDSRLRCSELGATITETKSEAGYRISASIGHVSFMTAPVSTAHALHQADEAMYAAKKRQKSCTPGSQALP